MSDSSTIGYFGPPTSSIDWCEANYQFSYYIAEMANTVSNFFTIFLALRLVYFTQKENLPTRYTACSFGFLLVGLGSLAFHASLLYEAQLADELPMIYVASSSLWTLIDTKPGFKSISKLEVTALLGFDLLFTWSYYVYRNPVYHQIVFASLVFGMAGRTVYLLNFSKLRHRIPAARKSFISRCYSSGAAFFAFGFFIWNLDNIFCDLLTDWKQAIGWPAAFLLEGHAWWHIFTALGSYLMSIGGQYMSLHLKDNHEDYNIAWSVGLPYIERTHKKAL